MLIAGLLAGVIGVTLGLLGGGGSVLTVPVLVYLLGFGAREAVVMSLWIVGLASVIGSVRYWRNGSVDVRIAAIFASSALPAAFLGARAARLVSEDAQLLVLAVVMVVAAGLMLKGSGSEGGNHGAARRSVGWLIGEGVGVGALTGFVGVGGGFLIVPALVFVVGLPMRTAIGTSLLVISVNSAAGIAGYLGSVSVPLDTVAFLAGAAAIGILMGSWASQFLSVGVLRRGFAGLLIGIGMWMLWQQVGVPAEGQFAGGKSGVVEVQLGDKR